MSMFPSPEVTGFLYPSPAEVSGSTVFAGYRRQVDGSSTWGNYSSDPLPAARVPFVGCLGCGDFTFTTTFPGHGEEMSRSALLSAVKALKAVPSDFTTEGPLGGHKLCIEAMVDCAVPAQYERQVWIRDHAMSTGGISNFNALPNLLKLSLKQVKQMFSDGCDLDVLSEGVASCADHNGPFEVRIHEADLVTMICLYTDNAVGEMVESGSLDGVTEEAWETFSARARELMRLKSSASLQPSTLEDADRSPLRALSRLVNAFGSNYPASVREDMDFAREVIAEARVRNSPIPGESGGSNPMTRKRRLGR